MLNRAWMDPRDVDWSDSLNPLRVPGWNQNNNPFVWSCLKDPFMQALRLGKGIEPRIYTGPDPENNTIQPGQTQDYEVPSEPNFWCYAIAASSDSAGNFLINVTDSVSGARFFSQPVSSATINPGQHGTSGRGVQFFLATPHTFSAPAYPIIRVINVDPTNAQVCRVTLFGCVEYDL